MFNTYMSQCNDEKMAVRQMCRKLDLYWAESVYDSIAAKSTARSIMTQYLSRVNSTAYAGKSYDDTLSNEGVLWIFGRVSSKSTEDVVEQDNNTDTQHTVSIEDIPDDVKAFWGSGYTAPMYLELEQRREYWMSELPDDMTLDIGTKALIRQICFLELDTNRDRAAGKPVDKNIAAINTILGSLNLKPVQKKQDDIDSSLTNTPLGVWLYRYENERPLPEIDDNLKDVNRIKKYMFTWMGHLCKMLGIKNSYSKMYEDEISRLRVERPEYDGDDDETMMMNIMDGVDGEGGDDS